MSRGKLSRRRFLSATAGTAVPALPLERLFARSGQPTPTPSQQYVRVRGIVRADGQPLADVPVTNGLDMVLTDRDGEFNLFSTSHSSFCYLTLPSGFEIPKSPAGNAWFYRPLLFERTEQSVEFDLRSLPEGDENHRFLLLADPQIEDQQDVKRFHNQTVPDLVALTRAWPRASFGFGAGDLVFDHLELLPEYLRGVAETALPFFQAVGNHDLDQSAYGDLDSTRTFESRFGPTHFSFNRGAVHYVVLDDVFWHGGGYIGYLTETQLKWLASDLRQVERGRPVVVVLHIPLQGTLFKRLGRERATPQGTVLNRDALYELLAPFQAHVLSAHTHENEHVFANGVHEHIHGAVCGAWWTAPVCYDGTPNGYGVYEVRGEEIRWVYKSTGSPVTDQIRVYPWGSVPSAPDEIVANVWNWDPAWQVRWYEDGTLKGPMGRRAALDPLAVTWLEGDRLPPKRPWVEPQPTSHLFFAPASRSAREIRIEATDRFGNVYAEFLKN